MVIFQNFENTSEVCLKFQWKHATTYTNFNPVFHFQFTYIKQSYQGATISNSLDNGTRVTENLSALKCHLKKSKLLAS